MVIVIYRLLQAEEARLLALISDLERERDLLKARTQMRTHTQMCTRTRKHTPARAGGEGPAYG